jgi:hypothetical protein
MMDEACRSDKHLSGMDRYRSSPVSIFGMFVEKAGLQVATAPPAHVYIRLHLMCGAEIAQPLHDQGSIAMQNPIPGNRPWSPIGLWDVKDPTLSRQSDHS